MRVVNRKLDVFAPLFYVICIGLLCRFRISIGTVLLAEGALMPLQGALFCLDNTTHFVYVRFLAVPC